MVHEALNAKARWVGAALIVRRSSDRLRQTKRFNVDVSVSYFRNGLVVRCVINRGI